LSERYLSTVQKVAADHDAGAALAGLAMHHGHVLGVGGQPGLHVGAEERDQREGGRVVVVERVVLDPAVELARVVDLLRAQVVDLEWFF
jgi:hypothetical protein